MSYGVIFGCRLRDIRLERFGEDGGWLLAEMLDLPTRTWSNYEGGVTMPAPILLKFIEATGVCPRWLLSGEGPRFSGRVAETGVSLIR